MIDAIFITAFLPSLLSTHHKDAGRHAAMAYYKYARLDVASKRLEERLFTKEQRKVLASIAAISNVINKKYITYTWSF